ncbi:DUF445 domain-containing protein [Parasediminibacterium sp. JCM 36343]|uniref:DUF445 domain-containing protein n=1 Tax=Parasediminibacterium sp. JCM 36343 TaxID=3374279 RepID=UPI00397B4832
MNCTLLLIPLFAAFIGWFTIWIAIKMLFRPQMPSKIMGIKLHGIFPNNQPQLALKLGQLASKELFSLQELESKMVNPDSIEKMMPFVEEHVDKFIRVTLAEKMPVISMFIGDKTIADLKAVFTEEMKTLFPALMKNYMVNLEADLDLEAIITQKIADYPVEKFEAIFKHSVGRQLQKAQLIAGVLGFVMGLFEFFLLALVK